MESEIFRIKTSFTHDKDHLVSRIKARNDTIFSFLERASHLQRTTTRPTPLRPSKGQGQPPVALNGTATELYQCFQKHLVCTCFSPHPCGVTVSKLDNESGKSVVSMKMLFLEGDGRTQVKVESFSMVAKGKSSLSQPTAPKLGDVSDLKQQFWLRNRVGDMQKTTPKSLFALAASSLNLPGLKTDKLERKPPEKKPRRPFHLRMPSPSSK